MKISILLTTYNSSKYIREQLDSLLSQTFKDWNLYIRDDGSKDNTLEILEEYRSCDDRIILVKDKRGNLGAAHGFMELLATIDSDYYMFCDHDDVWLADKIEKSYNKMMECESKFNGPVLIHTDLLVVDQNLNVINSSYWKIVGLKPKVITSGKMIQVFNCVTGCTMFFNRKVKEISLPYHRLAPMHDWWIAIQTINHGGIISQVCESLIKYRQHESNEVGAKEVNISYYLSKIKNIKNTFRANLDKLSFLKEIGGIGPITFLYFKLYYNIIRKF